MRFLDYLKSNNVFLDGGMGTLLQQSGLQPGERPESWNLSHPDLITSIHRQYFDAGSNVVCTNTFGANSLHFSPDELRAVYQDYLTGEAAVRTHDLVKAADKLSAYIKCIEERKAGNDEFLLAEKQTRAALEESALPEVRYFLDNFIPAFELTLDELGTIE